VNLTEIKQAIKDGHKVYHHNSNYKVIKDSIGQYLIVCESNNHAIGLTWRDGVTVNGEPEEFYMEKNDLKEN